jgi:hypothetical protein
MTGGSAILTELFVVASGLKYNSIAGHGPAGFWVNSIVTVAAAVAQPTLPRRNWSSRLT